MQTKTKTAADLEAEAGALVQQAEDLRAQQAEAEAAEKERRGAAVAVWEDDRAGRYVADFGGRIDRAWKAFREAVATGGDVHAAWVHYRTERRIVAAEYGANHAVVARREYAAYDAMVAELKWLNDEGLLIGDLASTGQLGGPELAERLAAWNTRLATFEGIERDPTDSPRAVAHPNVRDPHGRIGGNGGPDPREGESFAEAFDTAVRQVEERAVEAWRTDRKAERDAHVKAAKR